MEKKTGRVIWAAIAGILAGIFLGICIYCAITGTKITNLFQTSSSGKTTSTLSTTAAISPEASTTEPTTTISSTTAIAKNALVLPKESEYVEQHDVEIWSDEIEYDEYINLRY